jgi:hypothetical protein
MSGWVKIPEEWLDDPKIEHLPADVVLLHLTALAHCARHSSNGLVDSLAVRKLWPIENLGEAVKRLVDEGLWLEVATGWYVPDWKTFILSADEVEHRRELGKVRQERYRRHTSGDHSMCDRCSYIRNASRDASETPSVTPPPNRSDPTRRGGEGGDGAAGSAGAPPAHRIEPHAYNLDEGDECPCGLPLEHEAHPGAWKLHGRVDRLPHLFNHDDVCCPYDEDHHIHSIGATA